MSKYIRSLLETFDFDGDKVSVRLRPISFEDFVRFNSIPIIEDASGKPTMDGEEISKLIREILPKYIDKIEGLRDAAGSEIVAEEIFQSPYFITLVMEIGAVLIKAGTPANPLKSAEQ